jgi:hypothetical protein
MLFARLNESGTFLEVNGPADDLGSSGHLSSSAPKVIE